MPVAIAINIVLGYTVQTVLKLPIYLDSIGTILVGVLAGPLAGALTGHPVEPDLAVRAGHRRRHDRRRSRSPPASSASSPGIWGYLGRLSPPARDPGSQLLVAAAVAAAAS